MSRHGCGSNFDPLAPGSNFDPLAPGTNFVPRVKSCHTLGGSLATSADKFAAITNLLPGRASRPTADRTEEVRGKNEKER